MASLDLGGDTEATIEGGKTLTVDGDIATSGNITAAGSITGASVSVSSTMTVDTLTVSSGLIADSVLVTSSVTAASLVSTATLSVASTATFSGNLEIGDYRLVAPLRSTGTVTSTQTSAGDFGLQYGTTSDLATLYWHTSSGGFVTVTFGNLTS